MRHAGVGVGVGLWGPSPKAKGAKGERGDRGERQGGGKTATSKALHAAKGKSPPPSPPSPPRQILAKSTEMIRQSSLTRLGCIINTAVNGAKRCGKSTGRERCSWLCRFS